MLEKVEEEQENIVTADKTDQSLHREDETADAHHDDHKPAEEIKEIQANKSFT